MSKSPSLRRIQADIRELLIDPSDQYHAAPLENDMFVWHFTIRGAVGTDFEGGVYHGKILLPAEYPFKPPNIMFLTPTGRFETHTKLCLSFSAYHPELWQPAWGIRLILEALISFLPTKGDGAIGALDWTSAERKRLAKESVNYHCPTCGNCKLILDKQSELVKKKGKSGASGKKSKFQKEIEQLHKMQDAAEGGKKKTEEKKDDSKNEDEKAVEIVKSDEGEDQAKEVGNKNHEHVEHDQKMKANDDIKSDDKQVNTSSSDDKSTRTTIKSESNDPVVVNEDAEETKEVEEKDDQNVLEDEKAAEETTNDEIAIDEQQQPLPQEEIAESPLLSDPVVHTGIVVFSAIVFLLIRKLQDIVADMRELEAQFHTS